MDDERCDTCGDALGVTVAGLCPSCLLQTATLDQPLPELPDYELEQELGRGGMGVVYRAHRNGSAQHVALKLIGAGEFASRAEFARFRAGALIAGGLAHPNVVRIDDCSHLDDDQPFFTMELIEGGTLADPRWQRRFSTPDDAAELMIAIAHAVHFLHQHGVLHRDLKPANILIGSDERPIVSDFGAAKTLDIDHARTSGAVVGTFEYMASELLAGRPEAATVRSDVYALGAMFYELLTGQPPFIDDDLASLIERIKHEYPAPPRQFVAGLAPDLETVCCCALNKDPARRYQSAEAFAEDLARVLRGESIVARRRTARERVVHFAQRHPRITAAIVAGVSFLLFVAATAGFVSRMQEQELLRAALDTNEYAAKAQAGAMLYQLREYANLLEAGARDPLVQAVAARPQPSPRAEELARHTRSFDNTLIVAPNGRKWARWPTPDEGWFARRPTFDRDYRKACMRFLERGDQRTYVARSFRASGDGNWVFALCTPIFGADNARLGLLIAIITAAPPRQVRPWGNHDNEPVTALLGPSETSRAEASPATASAPELTFLTHPSLKRGARRGLAPELSAALGAAFGSSLPPGEQFAPSAARPLARMHYRDPLLPKRWLAAFAPVGGTGYVVLVQSREDVVLRPARQLVLRLAAGFAVGLTLVLSLFGWFVARTRRRARPGRTRAL